MVIKLSSNAIFIRVQLDSGNIPCGPSMMDYPETSGNLRKLAVEVSGRFPDFLLVQKRFQSFLLTKTYGNLPDTATAGFRRFPEVSG